MKVTIYVVMEPGFDRPCVSITPPHTYQKKPGSKIYTATLDLPDWCEVDRAIKELQALEESKRACKSRSPFGGWLQCSLEPYHEGGAHLHL